MRCVTAAATSRPVLESYRERVLLYASARGRVRRGCLSRDVATVDRQSVGDDAHLDCFRVYSAT